MFPDFCYGHKMCVVTYNRTFAKLDGLGKMDYGSESHFIQYEGAYMFGGVRGAKSSEFRLSNSVFRMSFGDKQMTPKWSELETKGIAPVARYHHGMEHYAKANMLIVFAGRKYADAIGRQRTAQEEFVS
jgi:hypothetical protein